MYLEQPSSAKPKMFHNIQHFWSQSECVMLKQLSKELDKHEGKVHSNNNKSKQTNSVRSVDVYPVPMKGDFIHLYQMIYDAIKEANEKHFRFDIAGIFDNLQLLHYKKGDHYDWHTNIGDGIYSNRKISATILLSDNCDGGDLVLKQGADRPIHMEVGDMVLFPSYVLHKVKPITKGERWSLVTWVQDTKPFK